ncbi:hypothetical protein BGW37DRAFT_523363 [Umbelopsis sp. PMI_123]|nr:hypothetical protein BGW37DRAFT_523363 [Umbelopsis sp. PMI_123]
MKLLAISLLLLASQTSLSLAEIFSREPSYWSPKNIFISVLAPGASHTTWVLEIAQDLVARGHNVSFLCKDLGAKIAEKYPTISILPMGKESFLQSEEDLIELSARPGTAVEGLRMFLVAINSGFQKDYLQFAAYITSSRPDLMICDILTDSCMRAAEENNIPFIVTSTSALSPDATAPFLNSPFSPQPTTEHQSIWTRFYDKYIEGLIILSQLGPLFKETVNIRKELGISSANNFFPDKLGDSVKLVNNFFGLELARSIGPLVRYVGPVMPSEYPQMDASTLDFLNSHQKIIYIAFGHHATPSTPEAEKLLISLVDSVEEGTVDGFIWATMRVRHFPKKVVSTRGTKLNVTDILHNSSKYPHYKFAKWAPQFAILSHPSTALFMTHGGANSIFESLYNGKKMLVHPFFADQPANAKILSDAGVALSNNRQKLTTKSIVSNIRTLVQDKDGIFQDNLKPLSALAQMKAMDAKDRGVAAIEEVLFTSKGVDLPHLHPASRNMTYMKANNIDIQILLAVSAVSVIAAIIGVVYKMIRMSMSLHGRMKKSKLE